MKLLYWSDFIGAPAAGLRCWINATITIFLEWKELPPSNDPDELKCKTADEHEIKLIAQFGNKQIANLKPPTRPARKEQPERKASKENQKATKLHKQPN